jgi:putative hydrolases of HD superfamily
MRLNSGTTGEIMENIVKLLFEAKMLNRIPRSGYQFLGAGKESVAERDNSIDMPSKNN